MRVVIACELSGIVRDAFISAGHDAISVDIEPTESPGPHYQGDIWEFFSKNDPSQFDLMIAHPPCYFLCNSGARWFYHPDDTSKPEHLRRPHPQYPNRWADHYEAVIFFKRLWELPVPKICIENPIPSVRLTRVVGKYTQICQPWWFGDPYKKGTALWLKNLPPLQKTNEVPEGQRVAACHEMSPGPDRSKRRSMFYPGFASAMAAQWG